MFVSSVDATNPAKNAIYRIAPDGTFLGRVHHVLRQHRSTPPS